MSEDRCFTYWTVECKTPDCGTLLLDYIGPCDIRRVVYLRQCRDFDVVCAGCMKNYTYSRNDVHSEDTPNDPTGFIPALSFQVAIRSEPPQDAESV
jgi:hypothetical protein